MLEELKQWLYAKAAKLERYKEGVNQYKISKMFVQTQKRVYQQMHGIRNINNEQPNAEESKQFWSNIWDNDKEHEKSAEWLGELRAKKGNIKQNDIIITTEMIKGQVKKIPNWKSQVLDGVQGSWLKKWTTLHERLTKQMDNISDREDIQKWMTLGKAVHKNVEKKVEGPKIKYCLIRQYSVTVRRDIQLWEWHGLIIRRLMIYFPIPGYWKALNLSKCLTTSLNL